MKRPRLEEEATTDIRLLRNQDKKGRKTNATHLNPQRVSNYPQEIAFQDCDIGETNPIPKRRRTFEDWDQTKTQGHR